jgi:hypothetical protein
MLLPPAVNAEVETPIEAGKGVVFVGAKALRSIYGLALWLTRSVTFSFASVFVGQRASFSDSALSSLRAAGDSFASAIAVDREKLSTLFMAFSFK